MKSFLKSDFRDKLVLTGNVFNTLKMVDIRFKVFPDFFGNLQS